jgi:hypothetical protein
MRVPTLDAPSVGQARASGYDMQVNQVDTSVLGGVRALGQGVKALGGATGDALKKVSDEEEKARLEAQELQQATKLLEFNANAQRQLQGDSTDRGRIDDAFDGTDTSKGGFLRTRGLEASARSAATLGAMESDRKRLAETISDRDARQLFLLRSQASMLGYRKQVETHVGREFGAAQDATADALEQQVAAAAESGVADFDAFRAQLQQADAAIDGVSRSPEEAKARKARLRSTAGAAFATSLVAQGREEEAAEFVEQNRAELGSRYAETSAMVARGAQKKAATRDVVDVLAKSRGDDDFVDPAKAIEAFRELDDDAQVRAAPLFNRELAQEAKRKAAAVDGWRKRAGGQFNKGGFAAIDADVVEKLNKYDPDYLRRLRSEDEVRQRRARARAGGQRTSRAELQNDKLWITRFKALGTRGMSEADVDDFVMGHGLTELGVAEIQRLKTYAGEKVQGGEGRAQQDMQNEAERQLRALPRKARNELNEDDVTAFRGAAFDAFSDFLEENKRPPTAEERSGMIGDLLRKVTVESPRVVFGFTFGTSSEEKRGFKLQQKPGAVKVRFPNGQTFDVAAEKLDAAKKRGGVVIDG